MVRVPLLASAVVLLLLAGCVSPDSELTPGSGVPDAKPNVGGTKDLVATSVPEGEYDFKGPYSRVLNAGTLKILPAERVTVPSAIDGADILMGLHLPETDEPAPVLLFASPYFGFLGGGNDVTDRGGAFGNLVENFVPHGYAVVGLAIRGTGGAGGCNDLMGPKETDDLDQAVTWLGTQDWSNGNVAMTGVSYDGSTPWGVASRGNPHLKTIIPISGVPDMFGLMYRNGTSESRGPVVLNALYYAGNTVAGTAAPGQQVERILCPEAVEGIGWSAYSGVTGDYDPQGFWKARDRKPGVEANYKGSVFSVQGLQDWNVDPSQVIPWVDQLEEKGFRTKQLLGQWGHAWPDSIGEDGERAEDYRADHNEILLRWLDQELKGLETDTGAPVQIRDTAGRWRNEAHFPPRDAEWQMLYPGSGKLNNESGPAQQVRLRPVVNGVPEVSMTGQFPVEYVDFRLGPVEKEMLISGLPKVHMAITPDGPGGYLSAHLYEREPDNTMNRIGWTSINLAYANGGTEMTPVVPGETIMAKMEIQPMDGVVRAGNQLVLRIWVNTHADRTPALPPSSVTLEVGGDSGSVLKLPLIERGPEVYFEPPTPAKEEPQVDEG